MSPLAGTCMSMCPQNEIKLRIMTKRVHVLENSDSGNFLVKEFIRAGAGNQVDPAELRPIKVLLKTTFYLVKEVIPRKDLPFLEIYNFAFDRFRAIRQDLSIQSLEGDCAIKIYEIISRFLLYSSYRLCDEEEFCKATNMRHSIECLLKLSSLYRTCHSCHESEFISYQLLACFGDPGVLMHALPQFSLRKDKLVKTALSMNLAWIQQNHFRVLKMASQLTPLQACIFHHNLNFVRTSLVKILSAAYCAKNVNFPFKHLSKMLLFDEEAESEDCSNFLMAHEIETSDMEKVVFGTKSVTAPCRLKQRKSLWVESLLNSDLEELIAPHSDVDEVAGNMEQLDVNNK